MEKENIKEIKKSKSNDKIEMIIKDYPKKIIAYPRPSFEDQLRIHLIKHNVGENK